LYESVPKTAHIWQEQNKFKIEDLILKKRFRNKSLFLLLQRNQLFAIGLNLCQAELKPNDIKYQNEKIKTTNQNSKIVMMFGQGSMLSGECCVACYTHQPDYRLSNKLSYPKTNYQTNYFTRPHHLIFAFYIVILIFDF
jgi:hypothetical protein